MFGALLDRVRVVRVDVVDVHHHLHGGEPTLERAVDHVDVGVLAPDHHHAVAEVQPREQAVVPAVAGFHARLAVLDELEHAHEVLERGALVAVREARVHVGQAALDRGLGAGVVDGRHESLLLTREHRRVTGIVGPDPVGSQLTQRIEVVVHPSLPVVVVEFADSHSRPVEAGAHGADRHAERGRDLVVAELLPDEQQQRVAFSLGKRGDRVGDARPEIGGVDRGDDPIARIVLRAALGDEARRSTDPARFAAVVLGDEVGGDAVQPRARRSSRSRS